MIGDGEIYDQLVELVLHVSSDRGESPTQAAERVLQIAQEVWNEYR